ncbi:MAG: hypothetical protein ACXWQE_13820, partial [Bdellovibrionales bacterium]
FGRTVSFACSLIVFFMPVAVWFFPTFHLQLALLFMFSGCYILERLNQGERKYFVIFFVSQCVMLLSLSILIAAFVMAYMVIYQWIIGGFKINAKLAAIAGLCVSAVVLSLPQFISFFEGISHSVRLVGHYDALASFEPGQLFYEVMSLAKVWRWHPDDTVLLTFPLLAVVLLGVFLLYRREQRSSFAICIFLGVIPVLSAYVLMTQPDIWWSIPLVKSIDLTRIIWISTPFLILGVGEMLSLSWRPEGLRASRVWCGSILVFFLIIFLLFKLGSFDFAEIGRIETILGLVLFIFSMFLIFPRSGKFRWISKAGVCGIGILLIGGLLYEDSQITKWYTPGECRSSHHFSNSQQAYFRHPEFLAKMETGSRYTYSEPVAWGNDFRGVYNGMLGSNELAITAEKKLLNFLDAQNLINIEPNPNQPYAFKPPWNADILATLGIRYVVVMEGSTLPPGPDWTLIARTDRRELYENRWHPTVISLDKGLTDYIHSFSIVDNDIKIDLPVITSSRVMNALFVDNPAMQVQVDGKPREKLPAEDPFIHVNVGPGDRQVIISYERFGWAKIFLFVLLGLGGFAVCWRFSAVQWSRGSASSK